MPSPSSTTELLELVRRSGIVGLDSLDSRLHEVHGLPGDPVQSAALLVQKGIITRFQAKLLLTGRYRGFKLGPYIIREQLGQGGMGAVYLAEHETLRRKVALKVLNPPKDDHNGKLSIERFLREARSAAALDHPNIVRIHDVSHQSDVHYLALEYVDGQTLEDLLGKGGPISPSRAVGFIAQAAAGLQHAHEKGFVHRDIKPSNLILAKDGTVKLLDMGLARSNTAASDRLTEVMDQGAIVGTADFISPEQAMNQPNIDIRADVYSLGATFYALVAGRPPFSGNTTQKLIQHQMKEAPSLESIDKTLPPELCLVVAKMLHKKPEKRYQTPAEVVTALAPWLGEDGRRVAAGLATTEAATSSVELQNTMSEIATGGSTQRLNKKSSKRLGSAGAESGNAKIYAAAGAAVALAAVLVGWAVLGGGEKSPTANSNNLETAAAQAAIAKTVANNNNATNSTKANNTKTKAASTKAAPTRSPVKTETGPGMVVYRFDPAQFPAGQFKLRGTSVIEGSKFPVADALNFHCWKPDSVGEFFTGDLDGKPAIGVANREGEASAQIAIDLTALVDQKLKPDGVFTVRLEYKTTEGMTGNLYFQNKNQNWAGLGRMDVAGTGGEWKTVTGTFQRAGTDPVQIAINGNSSSTGFFYVRRIEVIDPTAQPTNDGWLKVYELDLSNQIPFEYTGRVEPPTSPGAQKKWVELSRTGDGKLPDGWEGRTHNVASVGRYQAKVVDGSMALGMECTAGQRSAMLIPPTFDSPLGHCKIRVEYKTDPSVKEFKVRYVQRQPEKKSAVDIHSLPGGNGWQTAEWEQDLQGGTTGMIEFHDVSRGTLWLRKLTISLPDPAGGSGQQLYALDMFGIRPFTDRGRTTAVRDQDGDWETEAKTGEPTLPAGWVRYNYNSETVSEYAAKVVDGQMALGVTVHSGQPSAMYFLPKIDYPSGRAKLRLEYKCETQTGGPFVRFKQIEPVVKPAWDVQQTALPNGNGAWQTAELDVDLKGATAGYFELHLRGVELGKAVWYRAASVFDPATATSGEKVMFRLSAADLRTVSNTKKGHNLVSGEKEEIPAGIYFAAHKPDTENAWEIGRYDGVPAIRFVNMSGPASTQIGIELEKADGPNVALTPGKKYTMKVTYKTAGTGHGRMYFQTYDDWKTYGHVDMPNANDEWTTIETTATRENRPLRILVDAEGHGEGNELFVREVVVVEAASAPTTNAAATATAAKKAPVPAAAAPARVGKSIFAIDLKAGQPFRYTVEKRKPSEDPSAFMPAGVYCHCWKDGSIAEFRGVAAEDKFAIGVTNLNDDLSSQMMFGIEDGIAGSAQPGKKYVVRLEYQTKNDAHGKFMVRGANYQTVGETELPGTNGAWKTAELTFTRGTDKLDSLVQNESVGEGNTLYVRKFEVFEQE